MTRRRPKSRRHPQSRARSHDDAKSERKRWESSSAPLLLALALAVAAAFTDWAAVAFTLDEYRLHGHIHIELGLVSMGLALTVVALIAGHGWWKLRSTRRP
ncbi:MAG: hypothetical protein U0575_17160 [Phycisphaerales bacterium]